MTDFIKNEKDKIAEAENDQLIKQQEFEKSQHNGETSGKSSIKTYKDK